MYDFVFYFFYGILKRRNDDTVFTSIIGVFLLAGLHLMTIIEILVYFKLIKMPVFSSTYLYNKLSWYIPWAVVLGIIYMYFGKKKTKTIIEKYSSKENFYSLANNTLFLLIIGIPVLIIVLLK